MNNQKRSGEHERQVQELRRSNAAGAHGSGKYSRRVKYPVDYLEIDDENDGEAAERADDDLV
jgi:hypothetical protein